MYDRFQGIIKLVTENLVFLNMRKKSESRNGLEENKYYLGQSRARQGAQKLLIGLTVNS